MQFPIEDTKELFLTVLPTVNGRISTAADMAFVSVSSIYNWMKDDERFNDAVQQIQLMSKEVRLDKAEDVIDEALDDGDNQFSAAKYVLDNQGQTRGFGKGRINATQVNIGIMGNYPDDPITPEAWCEVRDQERKLIEEGDK